MGNLVTKQFQEVDAMLETRPLKKPSGECWTRILFSFVIFSFHSTTSLAANKCMAPNHQISYLDTPCPAGYKDMGEINEQINSPTSTDTSPSGIRKSEKEYLKERQKEESKEALMKRRKEAGEDRSDGCDKLGRNLRYYQNQSRLSSEDKENAYWQKKADDAMAQLNKNCFGK